MSVPVKQVPAIGDKSAPGRQEESKQQMEQQDLQKILTKMMISISQSENREEALKQALSEAIAMKNNTLFSSLSYSLSASSNGAYAKEALLVSIEQYAQSMKGSLQLNAPEKVILYLSVAKKLLDNHFNMSALEIQKRLEFGIQASSLHDDIQAGDKADDTLQRLAIIQDLLEKAKYLIKPTSGASGFTDANRLRYILIIAQIELDIESERDNINLARQLAPMLTGISEVTVTVLNVGSSPSDRSTLPQFGSHSSASGSLSSLSTAPVVSVNANLATSMAGSEVGTAVPPEMVAGLTLGSLASSSGAAPQIPADEDLHPLEPELITPPPSPPAASPIAVPAAPAAPAEPGVSRSPATFCAII